VLASSSRKPSCVTADAEITHRATEGNIQPTVTAYQNEETKYGVTVHPSSFSIYITERQNSGSCLNPLVACSAQETEGKTNNSCQQNRSSWAESNWTGSPTVQRA